MDEGKIKLTVIFGEKACEAFYDGGMRAVKKVVDYDGDGAIEERYFDTDAEKDAYVLGLSDADGWFETFALTDEELAEYSNSSITEGDKVRYISPDIVGSENRKAAAKIVYFVESIDDEEETAWIREDGDVFARIEVNLDELELYK